MKDSNKAIWRIVILFGVIAVIIFADTVYTREVRWSEVREQVEQARDKMHDFEPMGNIYEDYGGKHDGDFYAEFPVVVINKGGETKDLHIHFDYNGKLGADCPSENKSGISGKWSNAPDGWQANFQVKSGSEMGCYPIRFTNDVNSAAFDVLVVVK